MQGPLAQLVALTCYGNSAIRGQLVPTFFPVNSTCQFCEFVKFIAGGELVNGERKVATMAETPDQWIRGLQVRGVTGLRLRQRPQSNPKISDRMSAGFVGGGRLWSIEGLRTSGSSEFWRDKWEVGGRNSPEKRIWRVTYGLCEVSATEPYPLRSLEEIVPDLRLSLADIRAFSETQGLEYFNKCFDDALRALDDPEADVGYHKDLAPDGCLNRTAAALLKAAQSAWVFGGMGSWNDMGFQGEEQKTYERISDELFDLLNKAIEVAATSSMCHK